MPKIEKLVSYQTHAGDAGVVGDVGDVEDLSFVLAAGLRTCEAKQEGEIQAEDPEDSCWVNLDAGEPEGFLSALSGSFKVLKLQSHGAAKAPHG